MPSTLPAKRPFSISAFGLKAQGRTTAREIERAIRWDGVTYSCAGMGNRMVREYLQKSPQKPKRHQKNLDAEFDHPINFPHLLSHIRR